MRATLLGLSALVGCAPHVDAGPIPVERAREPARLLTLEPTEGEVVYLAAVVGAGSAHDPIGSEGLAWLTARSLVDAGAGERPSPEVREALYPLGTSLRVVVDKEYVSLRLACPKQQAATCVDLFADALVEPRFDAGDVLRLRDDALHAVTEGVLADEEDLGLKAIEDLLFEGHPYGHPVEGRAGVLPTLTDADARAFHEAHYVREATVAGLAGAWTPELKARLAERLEELPARMAPELPLVHPPTVEGRSLLAIDTETPVTGFHLGHPLDVDRSHPDYAALLVATTALGAHRQPFGRLFRVLRDDRGLNYGDYAYVEPWIQRGWEPAREQATLRRDNRFLVWIRPTSLENGPFALKLAVDELEAWVRDGIEPDELERVRAWLAATLPLLARDPGRRLLYALEAEAAGVPNQLEALPGALAALTVDEVDAAIAAHIRPDDLRIVAVSGEAEALVEALSSAEPTPITYADVEPGEAQQARDAAVAGKELDLGRTWTLPAEGLFR